MLSLLVKTFSRRYFHIFFFSYFAHKIGSIFHANCLFGDNLHEISNVFHGDSGEGIRNM